MFFNVFFKLVELDKSEKEEEGKIREEINKYVEMMNKQIPEYSRVLIKNVILLSNGQSLPVSHKGSIIRNEIQKKFQVNFIEISLIKRKLLTKRILRMK